MRVSLNWLRDLVDLPETPELARRLTMAGLECEGIEPLGTGLEKVVVARILESVPHPQADKLSVTQLDDGTGTKRQVVCGAKNYAVGDLVPLALPGAVLPGGVEIKEAALRGVPSAGMLCSAKELGSAESASGLLILPTDLKPGTPIAEALHLLDTALELNVTPNRADALSHLGIAREVATLTGKALRTPAPKLAETGAATSTLAHIEIQWPERCGRYLARVIEGVKVGPSPLHVQARLRAAGVRPINNVVDATNYALLELGHPLHAFDLDKVAGGKVLVRAAQAGEKLPTLDGKERTLDADDLVIADAEKAIALAGVMGGANSEVTEGTTRLLLESAWFQPSGIRRSARRHGLHTEASHRFERGTDVEGAAAALERVAGLIAEWAGGEVRPGAIDVWPTKAAKRHVSLRHARLESLLGTLVPESEPARILTALGFEVTKHGPEQLEVAVPFRRVDVEREEDLIEEVARIRGYDQVPERLPHGTASRPELSHARQVELRLREAMSAAGLSEVLNYSFVSTRELALVDPEGALGKPIRVMNPLSVEQEAMRTSLLPGLIQNLQRSLRHQSTDVRLYELGRVYRTHAAAQSELPAEQQTAAVEELRLGVLLHGRRASMAWHAAGDAVDFYDAKAVVEAVLGGLGIEARYEVERTSSALHPRRAARLVVGGTTLGTFGELHPRLARAFELPEGVLFLDLDVGALGQAARLLPRYRGLPRFPAVLRDLAFVVEESVSVEQAIAAIREAGGAQVEAVTLFDVYRGGQIPPGKKSLAFAVRHRAADRTLNEAEAVAAQERIVEAVGRAFGAALRA